MSLVCRFLLRWRVVGYSGNIQGNCMNHILETQKPVKEGFLAILQYYQGWYHRRAIFFVGWMERIWVQLISIPSLPGHWIHQIPSKVPVECTLQASRLKKSADFSYDRQVWSLPHLRPSTKGPGAELYPIDIGTIVPCPVPCPKLRSSLPLLVLAFSL